MAERHQIDVNVTSNDNDAKTAGTELRALAGVTARLSPEMATLSRTFRSLVRISEVFGSNMISLAGAGGIVFTAISAIKQLQEAAEQAAEQLLKAGEAFHDSFQDLLHHTLKGQAQKAAKGGLSLNEQEIAKNGLENARSQLEKLRSAADAYLEANMLPQSDQIQRVQMLRENMATMLPKPLLTKEVTDQNVGDVMKEIGDYLNSEFKKYESQERDYSKILDNQQKAEEKARKEREKEWTDGIKKIVDEALHGFDKIFSDADQKVKDYLDDINEYKDFQSEAPPWLQERLAAAGKNTTVKREDWSSFINAMDKIGGYMSGFVANIGQDRQLDELKKQTTKLNEIAVNTKNNSTARYN